MLLPSCAEAEVPDSLGAIPRTLAIVADDHILTAGRKVGWVVALS